MDPAGVPEGKECRLEITVNSYMTIRDGKKVYNRGRTVNWVVNPEQYAFIDLEKDIDPYFKWGSYQKATFWVLKGNNMQCKLASDAQLLDLLRSSDVVKLFMIVGTPEEETPACGQGEALCNQCGGQGEACCSQCGGQGELPPPRPKKPKKQRKTKSEGVEASTEHAEPSNIVHDPKVMSSPGVTTRRMASLSPASPGVTTRRTTSLSPASPGMTTRRMASLSPASPGMTTRRMASLSPANPGVTTRRMASVSPGGINRRLIIE